jgi:ubiquinone/menaquinone biosynthesis C-methylase UbiE
MIKEKKLFSSVQEKYAEDEIVEFYIDQAKLGLQDWEEEMVRRYVKKDSMILSVGCGAGREPIALSKYSCVVIGIDIVLEMLQKGYGFVKDMNLDRIHFAKMNVTSLGFQQDIFDTALLTGQVLTFIPKKAKRHVALKEIFRVLKPGGIIIMTTHSIKSHLKYKMYYAFINPLRRFASLLKISTFEPGDRYFKKVSPTIKTPNKAFLHMYTINEGIKDLESAGFRLLNIRSRKEWLNSSNLKRIEKDYIVAFIALKPESENKT